MYSIAAFRFVSDKNPSSILKSGFYTLEGASKARDLSGDIVVYSYNQKVVTNKDWLWDWEKRDENCFAHRIITNAILNARE